MAMDKSRKENASLADSAKIVDFFRQEVAKRRSQVRQSKTYQSLMVQIVERWRALTGSERETQGLKNSWLNAGLREAHSRF